MQLFQQNRIPVQRGQRRRDEGERVQPRLRGLRARPRTAAAGHAGLPPIEERATPNANENAPPPSPPIKWGRRGREQGHRPPQRAVAAQAAPPLAAGMPEDSIARRRWGARSQAAHYSPESNCRRGGGAAAPHYIDGATTKSPFFPECYNLKGTAYTVPSIPSEVPRIPYLALFRVVIRNILYRGQFHVVHDFLPLFFRCHAIVTTGSRRIFIPHHRAMTS